MKTYIDCVPCFFSQALRAARIAGAGERAQKEILDKVARALPGFSMNSCPSEMGRILYRIVREVTGVNDPYLKLKRDSNREALKVYGLLKKRVARSKDRLLAAVQLAIAGNIIDYGANSSLNVARELTRILKEENRIIRGENSRLFVYRSFRAAVRKAEKVLYIGDNSGEIVFDRILLEEIKNAGRPKEIIFSVKGGPVINDALKEDAVMCGIDKTAKVISNGVDAPGAILRLCSKKFLKVFNRADIIISKGQGNFEALSGDKMAAGRPVFFLFVVKCPVSSKHMDCGMGSIILSRRPVR
ncbi:MAG: ARMT1-like domain-containing protein [Candidatus Omnitrophota bacterium]